MRSSFGKVVLLVGACGAAGLCAWGKTSAGPARSPIDLAIIYNASRANIVPGSNFWMQGGSLQIHGQFWHGLGVVADVGGLHTGDAHGTGVGLDLVTATFGPRYTQSWEHHRYDLFGQALVGEAHGFDSAFPTATGAASSADGLALQAGGGMNLQISGHLAIRAFEAAWLRTQLPNATTGVENSLRVGSGLVFKF
jgi:hypothetical protein